jgi:hypothetical protein
MKKLAAIAYCLLSTAYCFAQLPESDIWLFDIKDSSGTISFSNPVNITNRKGYDNQPAFSPDGKYILYSSQRDSNGSTDIYKYDLKAKTTSQFTKTPTSEYSPTFMPDGKNISVVMVEKDSAQRLWKFPLAGGAPVCILPNIKEIGYHAWINKDSVALYILTKPSFTIQLVNVSTQNATILADSVGRCMRMKDHLFWYTTKIGILNNVFEYHPKPKGPAWKGEIESEDYCFYKNDIWSCSENSIVSGYMNSRLGAVEVANLEQYGITKITRITLSPDRKKIAVVSNK